MAETLVHSYFPDSLLDPSLYPVITSSVELIQTHISWLFCTDTHVYKIKKPVNLGFLDFSTLELRKFFCEEETRLNRRLCPDIYEGVVPLYASGTGVSFSGPGIVVEYAVLMKRLPADGMLDSLLKRGRVSGSDILTVAARIADFHAAAATSPYISDFGTLHRIQLNWLENIQQVASLGIQTVTTNEIAVISSFVTGFYDTHSGLFIERITSGFIRDCDGDIHLGNICIVHGVPYIFDCIEFDERFRYSDTAADIAFLLMDLDYHRRPDLSNAALTEYMRASGDTGCESLITFYKIYRAFIRGKVEAMQQQHTSGNITDPAVSGIRSRQYFRLALGYCVAEALPPTLYITCGTMGCGKSTLAEQLSFELRLKAFNSDIVRREITGVQKDISIQAEFGEMIYTHEVSDVTYKELERLAAAELSDGRSVVIDASFATTKNRNVFARCAAAHRSHFVIIYVDCEREEQIRRLDIRSADGGSVSDGRTELLLRQEAMFERPDSSEAHIVNCNTTAKGVYEILDDLYEHMRCHSSN